MADTSPRQALPLLAAAQAHKEIVHNEALLRIDTLLHPAVVNAVTAVPPPAPALGAAWIVAAGATGAWAQHPGEIALWQEGGWLFAAPTPGMLVWNIALGVHGLFDGAAWRFAGWPVASLQIAGKTVVSARQPAIAATAGGAVVDAEARAAIGQLLAALRAHGLIETL